MSKNGNHVGRVMADALKLFLILLVVIVMMGFGQFRQALLSVEDLRMKAIADWKEDNPDRSEVADVFVKNCINRQPQPIGERNLLDIPMSLTACAEELGAGDLVERISTADEPLKSLAWPLSMLD